LLLPGDMDWVGLDNLLEACPQPNARVLVFPHHGGTPHGGREREFARTHVPGVKPELVLFSIGRGVHNTPRPEIVAGVRAAAPSAHVMCTQLSKALRRDTSRICPRPSERAARSRQIVKTGNQLLWRYSSTRSWRCKHTAGAHRWRAQALRDGSRADCTVQRST